MLLKALFFNNDDNNNNDKGNNNNKALSYKVLQQIGEMLHNIIKM